MLSELFSKKSLTFYFFVFISLSACVVKNKNGTSDTEKNITDPADNLRLVSFPHPQGFSRLQEHGVLALTGQIENCRSCHGSDLLGGSSKVSCKQCHESYPHDISFKGNHGIIALGATDKCQKCHQDKNNSQLFIAQSSRPPQCASCHKSWPHRDGWLDPNHQEFHGIASLKEGSSSCAKCHDGNKLTKENMGLAKGLCVNCHASYPHVQDNIKNHGQAWLALASDKTGECRMCHNDKKSKYESEFKSKILNCESCHEQYPHPASFLQPGNPEFHGTLAKTSAKEMCSSCHLEKSNRLSSQLSAPQCQSCHAQYPHESKWVESGKHGKEWRTNQGSCVSCHQTPQKSIKEFCWRCHDYPHNSSAISNHYFSDIYPHKDAEKCYRCHNEEKKLISSCKDSGCHE